MFSLASSFLIVCIEIVLRKSIAGANRFSTRASTRNASLSTVSCPISGHFLQNCNILPQNSTNELKFSHDVAFTACK